MRITNVEKFRNELYEAIRDTCAWTVDTPSAIFKSDVGFKDSMTEYNHSEIVDDKPHVISLVRPMKIEGGELYITVDEDAVCFWKSEKCSHLRTYVRIEKLPSVSFLHYI